MTLITMCANMLLEKQVVTYAIVHTKSLNSNIIQCNSNISPKTGCYGNDPQSLNLGYIFTGQLDPENPLLESNSLLQPIMQPKL